MESMTLGFSDCVDRSDQWPLVELGLGRGVSLCETAEVTPCISLVGWGELVGRLSLLGLDLVLFPSAELFSMPRDNCPSMAMEDVSGVLA